MAIAEQHSIEVYGLLSDVAYQTARCCAEDLRQKRPDEVLPPVLRGMLDFEWNEFVAAKRRELKGETWVFEGKAMTFVNSKLIGGTKDLLKWAEATYSFDDFRPLTLYETFAEQQYKERMNDRGRVHCFMDIEIDNVPAGRLLIELYSDKVPKASKNFAALCTGECGESKTSGYALHYKNTLFHRVVPKGWLQAGDIWPPHKGNGGESTFGQPFEDESFCIPHDRRGVIGMANKGRHTNGSQFYITLQPTPWMDYNYVAIGQVIEGTETLAAIERQPTYNERPNKDVRIVDCGVVSHAF